MKTKSLIFILLVASLGSFAQRGSLQGTLQNGIDHTPSGYINIGLYIGNILVRGTNSDTTGQFQFENVIPGNYRLQFSFVGYETHSIDSIQVFKDSVTRVEAIYPCPYGNLKSKKICPFGHTDHIIPVVYGLPTKRMMRRAEKGKCYLGGCTVTECDPRWYCNVHKISF